MAAKLSRMSAAGNTGPPIFRQNLPNSGVSLYGRQAKFRLRLYTSGGMTPNGVTPLLPTQYDDHHRGDPLDRVSEPVMIALSNPLTVTYRH